MSPDETGPGSGIDDLMSSTRHRRTVTLHRPHRVGIMLNGCSRATVI